MALGRNPTVTAEKTETYQPEDQLQKMSRRWTPRATVACVIPRSIRPQDILFGAASKIPATDDLEFLMVEESISGATVFNQPAGHIEADETIAAAAVRETLEETGWQVELKALLGTYVLRINDPGRNFPLVYHRHCFLAEPVARITNKLDDAIIRAAWLKRIQLGTEGFPLRSTLVTACIDDYLAGKRAPLDFIQEFSS